MNNNTKDKSDLEKTIEEINNKSTNIPSQSKLSNEKSKKEQILDQELEIIREKIKNSNPKWKLENFDEFFYEGYSKIDKIREKMIKIYGKNEAKILYKIASELRGKDKNYRFQLLSKDSTYFLYISKELNINKINELIKSYIFYSNTNEEYDKLKFVSTVGSVKDWIRTIILTILILIVGIFIIGLLSTFIINIGLYFMGNK